MLEEAILYGGSGRALTLRIDLDRVHFKNPLKAIIVGDDNIAKGRVAVIDTSTGAQTGAFPVQVNAERGGLSGADVGTMILGALDPTGLVDLGSMAASAASANLNRSRTETGLRINFAREALRQTFGDAKAKAAHPKEK
ncbi:MAG: hypothetical protein Q8M88_04545 [Phenylobacterium sp.]|uniref:hypothetical protein n=1 Tax=Phenylobacterium sp. TaxID=1871053 RepID=UPI00273580E4|nr:hypothetical protein [Phenylobacterium sp.]MDP3173685.1 hypothetical protein [Phenylobacterium sp.]